MTFPGVSARSTAIACLIVAVALLVLVGLLAPTRSTPGLVTPTPSLIPAPTLEPTPLALLLAGSPVPHRSGWIVGDYRVTPTPTPKGAP